MGFSIRIWTTLRRFFFFFFFQDGFSLLGEIKEKKRKEIRKWRERRRTVGQNINKITDWSTWPLARPFPRSLAPVTRSIAPPYSLRSHARLCSLVCSLAPLRLFPHSWDSEWYDGYYICFFLFWTKVRRRCLGTPFHLALTFLINPRSFVILFPFYPGARYNSSYRFLLFNSIYHSQQKKKPHRLLPTIMPLRTIYSIVSPFRIREMKLCFFLLPLSSLSICLAVCLF